MLTRASDGRTLLESALKHERVVTATLIVLVPLVCWTWIALMARDMYGAMLGPSAWMMTADWDVPHLLLLWAMWAVMMTAMMLPSASPLVLLYAGALRTRGDARVGRKTYAMAAGYVLVWVLYSVAATVLQRVLSNLLVLDSDDGAGNAGGRRRTAGSCGVVSADAAEAVRACASAVLRCRICCSTGVQARSPHSGWVRDTAAIVWACCWALMLLLFAGGVMNLVVIVVLTLWVLAEKFAPFGEQTAKVSGVALLAVALWTVVR